MSSEGPEGWRAQPLSSVAKIAMGETLLSKNLTGAGVPVFSASTDSEPWGYTDQNRRTLNHGTIVVGARGSIGFPRLPPFEAFTSTQTTITVEPDSSLVDSTYLHGVLCAADIRSLAAQQAVPMLTIGMLAPLPILLPPLDEQRRIAEVLRSVDEAIASELAVFEQYQAAYDSTMSAFLTTGNDADDGVSTDEWITGRVKAVRRIPKSWRITRLVEVAKLESGHTPSRTVEAYWEDGDIGWISLHDTKNLERREIHETELKITAAGVANSSARMLPEGTVCLSRTATVGKCVIMGRPMTTSQDFANFVCSPVLNNRYLLHLFRWMGPIWKALSSGSTHKTIYMPTFQALQIVLPPIEEQESVAATLDAIASAIERSFEHLEALRALRRMISSDLLFGRVRVPA